MSDVIATQILHFSVQKKGKQIFEGESKRLAKDCKKTYEISEKRITDNKQEKTIDKQHQVRNINL